MTPEAEFLLAILKQAVRDYIRLDPDSDAVSAEFSTPQGEGYDYKTAEDFLFNNVPIYYGTLRMTYNNVCSILGIDYKKLKKKIARNIIEF